MVSIAFVGDVMLARGVSEAIAEKGPEYPWGNTLSVLRKADIRIANLECPISGRGIQWKPKKIHFRASPLAIDSLRAAGINCVSLANNHILDYGEDAMADTLMLLDRAGIAHAGSGRNISEAMKPAFLEADGITIGFISLTDNMPLWRATEKGAGVNHIPLVSMPDFMEAVWLGYAARPSHGFLAQLRPLLGYYLRPRLQYLAGLKAELGWDKILKTMKSSISLARSADFSVLSCHWGPNWRSSPFGIYRKFAKAALEGGADIIHGHSAHLFQGIWLHGNRPVLFDTGNFVDDYEVLSKRNDWSFIFLVDMDKKTGRAGKITLVPVCISHSQVNLASGSLADAICERMTLLCQEMGTGTVREGRNLVIHL